MAALAPSIMTKQEFITAGEQISRTAGVLDGLHGYFRLHAARLHQTCELFRLFERPLGDVLEIGPFFGYTPFVLRSRASSYTVLEGPDPAVRPLEPLYRDKGIQLRYADFFELFGPTRTAPHRLPELNASFDTILCWETMEHFNFNPVKFVRELGRVLKSGGRVCITVPNKASFQSLAALTLGRGEHAVVQSYFDAEDYVCDGKKAFYGFHWREYTAPELKQLFSTAGFEVAQSGTYTAFQDHGGSSLPRRLARQLSKTGSGIFPRFGTHVFLEATSVSARPSVQTEKSR
jgi:SAM-dependent methyltransferase